MSRKEVAASSYIKQRLYTSVRHITTFRLTMERMYEGGPIRL